MKRTARLLALLALCAPLRAAQTVYPAASQGGSWLDLPFSTRAASLAGLGGDGQGVDALSYNPAGLASTTDYEADLYQDYWLQDASSQRLGLALPYGPGGLGLAFDNVNFGAVDLYSVNGLGQLSPQGTTYPEAWALQAGYGLDLGAFSLGAAVKGLSQNLGGVVDSGYGVDLGGGMRLGDLGFDASVLQAVGELGGGKLPLNADLEATYLAWSMGEAQVDLLAGLDWLPDDVSTTGALGVEAHVNKILALRAGYRAANAQSAGGWAAGIGFLPLPWLGVDYAYNAVGGLQATNQLTLNLYWDRTTAQTLIPVASPAPSTPVPSPTPPSTVAPSSPSTPVPSPTPPSTVAPSSPDTPVPSPTPSSTVAP